MINKLKFTAFKFGRLIFNRPKGVHDDLASKIEGRPSSAIFCLIVFLREHIDFLEEKIDQSEIRQIASKNNREKMVWKLILNRLRSQFNQVKSVYKSFSYGICLDSEDKISQEEILIILIGYQRSWLEDTHRLQRNVDFVALHNSSKATYLMIETMIENYEAMGKYIRSGCSENKFLRLE